MEKPFLNLLLSSIFVQIDGLDGLSATQILECTENPFEAGVDASTRPATCKGGASEMDSSSRSWRVPVAIFTVATFCKILLIPA